MNPIQANALAAAFAKRLAVYLTPAQFDLVSDRNALLGADTRVCHSHDFCDANVFMDDAWTEVLKRDFDCQSDEDCALWGEAFARFRFHGSRIGRALHARGFRLVHDCGGCFNWRLSVGVECFELFCSGEDGQEPADNEPCVLGLMIWGGDTLCQRQHETGSELAGLLTLSVN